ncbi:MAG: LysR family transcriptional regulator [Polyangiaceae bacterium]|nr:LysR family transcriptional regulator [Polyangiaceae bacterium]
MKRTPLDYQLLAIFVAVADETSFSKAAAKLGMGKGTVSRAIAQLEELLGAELLHRNTHKVALSTAGLALYERTAHHLAALDHAVCKLPELAEQPSGLLRLTAPLDFGRLVLPDILAQFSRRYPDIHFDLHITNRRVDLVAEGFDVAIRAGAVALKDSTLTGRKLSRVGASHYAAPSYLVRRGKPKAWGEAGHDWIMPPHAKDVWKPAKDFVSRFVCDDFFLIRDLIRDGAGIGVLPRYLATPYVREGLIEDVPLGETPLFEGALHLLYPSSGQVPRKVAAFRDFVVDWLKRSPLE